MHSCSGFLISVGRAFRMAAKVHLKVHDSVIVFVRWLAKSCCEGDRSLHDGLHLFTLNVTCEFPRQFSLLFFFFAPFLLVSPFEKRAHGTALTFLFIGAPPKYFQLKFNTFRCDRKRNEFMQAMLPRNYSLVT